MSIEKVKLSILPPELCSEFFYLVVCEHTFQSVFEGELEFR